MSPISFRSGLRMSAAGLACAFALTVLAAPATAQSTAGADHPEPTNPSPATKVTRATKAKKIPTVQRLIFEQAVLKTQRQRLASAIRAIGAGDERIEKLLRQLSTNSATNPAGPSLSTTPGKKAGKRRSGARETLRVPTYAAPLFLQLGALDRSLDNVTAKLESRNRGDEFGLGIAAFPVKSDYEFVDSWGFARSGGRRHEGTDIMNPYGTPILAIEDGVIERYSSHSLGGLAIYFRGDSGALYYYAHLGSFGPQTEGQRVRVGEVIGANGDTGNARGTPHLHFQFSPTGDDYGWIDPYPLLIALSGQGWDPGRTQNAPTR